MENIFVFILGAMLGSAANALIDRLPAGRQDCLSWFTGRSHCDKCKHVLEWYDLIPIVSYLEIRGRCKYCHSPIPIRNLFVEVFMGVGFSLIINHLTFNIFQSIILMGIIWVTVVISVMDWETRLVSEAMMVVWGGLVIANQFQISPTSPFGLRWAGNIQNDLFGLMVSVGVIGGIWAISRGKAMGFGDVEIALVLGWWLGWPGIASGLWLAFVVGAIVGSYELLAGRKKLKSEIAFGPFLILGGWMAYFWGNLLWQTVVR